MQTPEAAYMDVKAYLLDLDGRLQARKLWEERHPDSKSIVYLYDAMIYEKDPAAWVPKPLGAGTSTFDPNDPEISTADVFTSERLVDILTVLVAAFETRRRD
jgi:hypothetical protein